MSDAEGHTGESNGATSPLEVLLPSPLEIVGSSGHTFHFFVESADGVSVVFDEGDVLARVKKAEEELAGDMKRRPNG